MARYIQEQDLDPTLVAKLMTGTGGTINFEQLLKEYVKRTEKVERARLGDSTLQYINDQILLNKVDTSTLYKKGERISADDMPLETLANIATAMRNASKALGELADIDNTIETIAAQKVSAFIANNDITTQAAQKAVEAVNAQFNSRFQALETELPRVNATASSNKTEIETIKNMYRKKTESITLGDLDTNVTDKFVALEQSAATLTSTKQDKISGEGGSLVRTDNFGKVSTDGLFVRDGFVWGNADVLEAAKKKPKSIVDIQIGKRYTSKFDLYNKDATIMNGFSAGTVLNSPPSAFKQETAVFTFQDDSQKKNSSYAGCVNITAGNKEAVFSFAFWGTDVIVRGVTPKRTAGGKNSVNAFIDTTRSINMAMYDEAAEKENVVLCSFHSLTIGFHVVHFVADANTICDISQNVFINTGGQIIPLAKIKTAKIDLKTAKIWTTGRYDKQDTSDFLNGVTVTVPSDFFNLDTISFNSFYEQSSEPALYMFDNDATSSDYGYTNKLLVSNVLVDPMTLAMKTFVIAEGSCYCLPAVLMK